MTDKELEASQALSQEIDRGFPAIPQSQLDDLIPLEGLDGDDEDKIMALYRTIQGPPKETAFTDEQLERYLAEVRRDALREGFRLGAEYTRDRVWGGFRANFMTSSQINKVEKEVYRILNHICDDIEEKSDWYCDIMAEDKERKAAEQGRGEGQGRKG